MLKSGLVSITFRKLAPDRIVELVSQTGAEAIEWGGDVHVPHGDLEKAKAVRALTLDAGLEVASYGSYYRVGHDDVNFDDVLATALALGAPIVRVWPGKQGSEKSDEAYWERVIEDSRRIVRMAASENIIVSYEYHGGTLTDTCEGALRLLKSVGEPNLLTHWQTMRSRSRDQNLEDLKQLLPYLCHLHVFHWPDGKRAMLADGAADWKLYLKCALETGRGHGVLIEHVLDDEPANYTADAQTLNLIMKEIRQDM